MTFSLFINNIFIYIRRWYFIEREREREEGREIIIRNYILTNNYKE